mgnify:CR=1 FL=1
MKVSLCSAFNAEKDGISDYSGYLAKELAKLVDARLVCLEQFVSEDVFYKKKADEANQGDIVHIQFNYPYFNGQMPYRNKLLFFLRQIKRPAVLTMHEVRIGYEPIRSDIITAARRWVFNNTIFFWNFWSRLYHREIFKMVNRIIVHTRDQYEMIAPLAKDKGKLIVIPHAIPIIEPDKKNICHLKAKERLGLNGKTVLSIFGFINKKKGYELTLACLKELPEDVVLLIAGGPMTDNLVDRQYYSFIEKEISAAELTKRVKITGYLYPEDIPEVMAATDICLAPFSSSSASGALSLCVAYNKPIIASDIEGHKEINGRLKCLELFRQGESKDLLDKINGFLLNQNSLSGFVEAAKAYSNEFSYAKIAERTVMLYREVLAQESAA